MDGGHRHGVIAPLNHFKTSKANANHPETIQDAALKAAHANGLVLDLAIGPNQGAGVPAPIDADSLQYNIVPFNISIAAGHTYDGTLPGWGTGALVAATTASIVSVTNSSSTRPGLPGDPNANRTQIVLSSASLADVSESVNKDGSISVSFPVGANSTDEGGLLFAFYKVHTEYREQEPPGPLNIFSPQSPVTSYVENGSFVVDHFSIAGAQAVVGFWEEYLVDDSTRELLAEVGNYGWEVSRISLRYDLFLRRSIGQSRIWNCYICCLDIRLAITFSATSWI